jgi:hypothetical protein
MTILKNLNPGMKRLILAAAFSFALCVAGCGGGTDDIVTLDAEAAIDNSRTFDLGEIAQEIEFIPLDNSDQESLLGEYLRIQESENRFYVYDSNRQPLKVFDKTGKFLSTRGLIGRGPHELPSISGFAVDYRRDGVYIKGGTSVIAYDVEGRRFARNDSIADKNLFAVGKIIRHNDNLIVLAGSSFGKSEPGSPKTLLELFSSDLRREGSIDVIDKGSTESLYLPAGAATIEIYPESGIVFDNGNSLFVKETLSDTVFRYENDRTLSPVYRLDLGRYYIPAEAFGPDPGGRWNDIYHSITDMYDGERYTVARITSFSGESFSTGYLVLDKDNPSDGFTATGPDGRKGIFMDGTAFAPMYVRDNRLVGYMQALDIVDNAASITNPKLKALAATLKEDSNPVVVVATLKNSHRQNLKL